MTDFDQISRDYTRYVAREVIGPCFMDYRAIFGSTLRDNPFQDVLPSESLIIGVYPFPREPNQRG